MPMISHTLRKHTTEETVEEKGGAKFVAHRVGPQRRRQRGCRRINRNGVIYYALRQYTLLNPWSSPLGRGLCFVRAADSDPTGVFFTESGTPTEDEVAEALRAYLFEFGAPEGGLHVLPATLWPRCYERTPDNIDALRAIGAPLPHERHQAD